MKFAAAVASVATLAFAQDGYVIDLCPTAEPVTPINLPSSATLIGLAKKEGFGIQKGFGEARQEFEDYEILAKLNQLNKMKMLGAAYEQYQQEQALAAAAAWKAGRTQQGWGSAALAGAAYQAGSQGFYPGAATMVGTYNEPVGVIERESFLPGGADLIQSRLALIPGADRGSSFVTRGYSYVPDSYTPGTYQFDASCAGQAVQVYNEQEPEVLWCGERDLQGAQTLKRTNIHHNYVHDINHSHNYHNRTRHAARQFNTVEKDCSCKGVAQEANYICPPGIEAPAARAVASSLVGSQAGTFAGSKVGALAGAKIVGSTDGLDCSCNCI